MKFKVLNFALAIAFVAVPHFASAEENVPVDHEEKPCDCQEEHRHHHHMMHNKDWQKMMAEREQKLLAWVDQYTPEKKADWTKVLEEKKQLHSKWMSPENATKREKWESEKKAKLDALKKQLDEGKITKEEFVKKLHGDKKMGHWKTFHELKIAVEKKDNKQATLLLNQLLDQTKQHNQQMKEMLK